MTIHPEGIFFDADTRSIEGDLYGICKRLQEEMCRQFHDVFHMRTIVLRADYIVDSRLGIGRHREKLGPAGTGGGWDGSVGTTWPRRVCLLQKRSKSTMRFFIS